MTITPTLALNQAGNFMRRRDISFTKYVELYKAKRRSADVKSVLLRVEDYGIEQEDQRAVWSTWKMNVEALTETARTVLTAFALFDVLPVPRKLVKQLDNSFSTDPLAFMEVVQVELGKQASLIAESKSCEGIVFEMHRLICDFILSEEQNNSGNLIFEGMQRAISASHSCTWAASDAVGESISNPPELCVKCVRAFYRTFEVWSKPA